MIRFFNPALTYQKHKEEFLEAIDRVLSNGDLILRKDVEEFEDRLAKYIGTKYAVALNSGTDALYLALKALGVGAGDKVLVPSYTFVATAQVVKQVGAEVVLYEDFDDAFDPTVRAVIVAHLEGDFQNSMTELMEVCNKHGIPVIEDAAQALGASQNGRAAGSFGIAGCFSFYPAKLLGAFGDAGGLTTNDENVYRYVKDARNHFKDDARDWGINSRMDNLQAAILNVKFPYLPSVLVRRDRIAKQYNQRLCDLPLRLPPMTAGRVFQDYIIQTDKRDELYDFLKKKGIECLKNNYPFPIPKLPNSQKYEDETLRIPCNENLTYNEVETVIRAIREFYA